MGEAIERLDGTREKFIGDAVFAVFGWPRAHDDDAGPGGARGARDPRDAARAGRRRRAARGPDRDRHRRGRGRRPRRRDGDLAVTGEAITTAARIQALARPGEILLDEATVRGARDRLAVEDRGSVVLRGQSPVVRLFSLSGEIGLTTQARAGRPGTARSSAGRPRWRTFGARSSGRGARAAAPSSS